MAEEIAPNMEKDGITSEKSGQSPTDSSEPTKNIAEYDKYNYDYKEYWNTREYENQAEDLVLNKLFRKAKGKRIIDVGGSFGRLLPIYYDKYEQPIIVDYSLKTLLRYEKEILQKYPNCRLVAANIYHLPFRDNSCDAALMVRVLHHINEPERYYKELSKVLTDGAIYVQEFANKVHLKARLKWTMKGDFKMLDSTPYQQPSQENFEGSNVETKETGIFLNFHPKHIKELLKSSGFKVTGKSSSSFLRVPRLKRMLTLKSMISLEKFFQSLLGYTNIAPSIFYSAKLSKDRTEGHSNIDRTFNEILICPACESELTFSEDIGSCSHCGANFKKHSTVWDFRVA